MFELVDKIVITAVQDKLQFLSENPHHIEFIFQGFDFPRIKEYVGSSYLNEVVKFVENNRLYVAPAYQLDKAKKPGVFVEANSDESQQYIGDYGSSSSQKIVEPKSLLNFSVIAVENGTLKIPNSYPLLTALRKGAAIKNNTFVSGFTDVIERGNYFYLTLSEAIPDGLDMRSWQVMTSAKYRACVTSSSTDRVSIRLYLVTNGDIAQHHIFRTIVKYALKSSRPVFEKYGLQVSSVSVAPAAIVEPTDMEIQSVFSLSGLYTETWIEKEYDLPTEIALCLQAKSCDPENEVVNFGIEL